MKKRFLVALSSLLFCVGLVSCNGENGKTPYIGENGNWWIDNSDTGVPATGPAGSDGANGSSVTVVSVIKISSHDLVDVYQITFSDGTKTTFTVTNGEANSIVDIKLTSTSGNLDTYTIYFSNGSTKTFTVTNGMDGASGKNLTIKSIALKSSEGLIDTYVITYSDGSKFEFVVTNGADGQTPYIGDNGNWWIGDTDTGVIADGEKANNVPLTIYSNGLIYETKTMYEKTGYFVTGWNEEYFDYLEYDLIANGMTPDEADEYAEQLEDNAEFGHLVIPNYIGTIPVIGVWENAHLNFGKVTLSRNTVFLGGSAFEDCTYLKDVDFNNAHITQIPRDCFKNTSVGNIKLPSSVKTIADYAFSGVEMSYFDFKNITYIGDYAFDHLYSEYVYLSKDVTFVGYHAFEQTRVYIEHETIPSYWDNQITSSEELNDVVPTNCLKNDEYIYSITNGEITVYQYIGRERSIEIPASIDGKPVKTIGYGFASVPVWAERYWNNKYLETGCLYYGNPLDVITIPNGVETIEEWTFYAPSEMVLIPNSVSTIHETIFYGFEYDLDNYLSSSDPAYDAYGSEIFLAFENSDLPTIIDENGKIITNITKDNVDLDEARLAFDVDFAKLEFDDNFCYRNEGSTYSLFAYLGLRTKNVVIPASFNNKKVKTILSYAFGYENYIDTIVVSDGIEIIRPHAIFLDEGESIYIHNSVLIINEYGVVLRNSSATIYVESNSKPVDWDSNWTNYLENAVYGIGDIHSNNVFLYSVQGNKVSLIKYLAETTNIFIPDEIDGKTVTEIKGRFVELDRGADIYIPSSITKIGAKAFNSTDYKRIDIYCQAASKPDDWDSNCVSGYGSRNYYWDQDDKFNYSFGEEYVYRIEDNAVTLCAYLGHNDTIRIPRTLYNKSVAKIIGYCFSFTRKTNVYIPNNVSTIEEIGFELYSNSSSYSCTFYCEAESKPSGWNSYWCYNTYYSSTYYINTYFNQTLD